MVTLRSAGGTAFFIACLIGAIAVIFFAGQNVVVGEPASDDGVSQAAKTAPDEAPPGPPEIHVPDGFIAEVVAGPPLVSHPMMAGFDDRGRLYVADALGVNLNAEELQRDLPNRIQRLEDTDGDGRFDRATTFADKMTFPMGAVWYRGAVYTASPPYIWRLEDTDDDGIADKREQIVGKFGFIGNAADIHGCFLGPDGRIYWCDGRHGHEFVDANGETLSKGQAARIFSCRPDGSDVQVYAGGGMDNPVEVAFTPEGEMLGTMTFYNPDEVRHDALVHYAYGGVYPRKHAVVEEFKRTGDFMPALSLYDTVAPAGLTRYSHAAFGPEFKDNFFSVQFNTHKVLRHVLTREKSSFTAADEDFLTSPSIDFHPTDVLEDADGSLLVIDTGGWFRHGCPTSQIAKPEILGAIYRIRRIGAPVDDDPRGRHLPWRDATNDELAARLADSRPAVRERAVDALALRGDEAVPAINHVMRDPDRTEARKRAVWALSRMNTSASRTAVRAALRDDKWPVRLAAARAITTSRDAAARFPLEAMLYDQQPAVRREVATALGRIGQGESIPKLVDAFERNTITYAPGHQREGQLDRHEEHAFIFALIEIGDHERMLAALAPKNPPRVQRIALIALDQVAPAKLDTDVIKPLLQSYDTALQQSALAVISRHEGWSGEILSLVKAWLSKPILTHDEEATLQGAISAFESDPELQQIMADSLQENAAPRSTQLIVLELIARTSLADMPQAWIQQLERLLGSSDDGMVIEAMATLRALPQPFAAEKLKQLMRDEGRPQALRLSAARTLARPGEALDDSAFGLLESALDPTTPPLERIGSAATLGDARLNEDQLNVVLTRLAKLSSLEIPTLARAFRESKNQATKKRLLLVMRDRIGLHLLDQKLLHDLAADLQIEEQDSPEAEELVRALSRPFYPLPSQVQLRLESLGKKLTDGDAERGRVVFFGKKVACASCHRVGQEGGQIGPDLTHIAAIRSPRDLLESILMPSASFARGYETYAVTTKEGHHYQGVIARETSESLHIRQSDLREIKVPRSDIDGLGQMLVSVMPEGLDRQLNLDEMADLISYLSSLK